MRFDLIAEYLPAFLEGIGITLWLVSTSFAVGLAMSVPLALARIYRVPVLAQLSEGYS